MKTEKYVNTEDVSRCNDDDDDDDDDDDNNMRKMYYKHENKAVEEIFGYKEG
jgi:hypothetical protein